MHYDHSYEGNYRRAIYKLINNLDIDFPNTEEDWDEKADYFIDIISRRYRKPYAQVLSDIVEDKQAQMILDRENDELRYGKLNEYGDRIG